MLLWSCELTYISFGCISVFVYSYSCTVIVINTLDSTLNHSVHLNKSLHRTQHKCTFSEQIMNKLSVSVLFPFPPYRSIHAPLFASCSSSPFLIYGPDFLPSLYPPPPLHYTDLPLFSCPSSFPAEEDRSADLGSFHAAEACVCLLLL